MFKLDPHGYFISIVPVPLLLNVFQLLGHLPVLSASDLCLLSSLILSDHVPEDVSNSLIYILHNK